MSEGLEPLRKLKLLRFSLLNIALRPFPDPLDIVDSRSGLSVVLVSFFRDPVEKTSLNFVPGEIPRPSLERLRVEDLSACSLPNVAA